MEFPRKCTTGQVVCLLVPEVSGELTALKPIREWSEKAKVAGATVRTTITGRKKTFEELIAVVRVWPQRPFLTQT